MNIARLPGAIVVSSITMVITICLSSCTGLSSRSQATSDSQTVTGNSNAVVSVADMPSERLSGATVGQGPVQLELPGATKSSIPEPPPEIIGVRVPSQVSELVPNYVTPPRQSIHDDLTLMDVPKPRLKKLRPILTGSDATDGLMKPEPPNPLAPVASTTFDSLDFVDNAANAGSIFIPADPSGAAGPDHVVSVVNVSIQFHTKSGTALLDSTVGAPITGISLASFFATLSPANATFDPKVLYDQDAERFVVVTLERTDTGQGDPSDTSRILLAVSDDADPNGAWFFTAIDSKVTIGVDSWADYPGFAVDEEAIYITANMFCFSSAAPPPCGFTGNRVWVVDKFAGAGGGLYGGGTATVSVFDPYAGGGFEGTTQPAHIFGTAPTTPNVGTWFIIYDGLSFGEIGGVEAVQVMRLDDPVGPGTPTVFGPFYVNLADIEDIGGSLGFPPLPLAPQMGSAETLATNSRRTLNAVWRNDRLYTVFTINPKAVDPDTGEATAHWIELDTSTLGAPALMDEGNIGGEDIAVGTHTFFPSISVNDSDDLAIGFSASASTIYPSSAFTTRRATDTPGTTTGSTILSSGLDYYIRTFDSPSPTCATTAAENRWGDYSGMAVDPFDQCFWAYNKHAIARGTGSVGGCNGRPATEDGSWGTSFANFCESCATNLALASITVSGSESYSTRDNVTASTVTVDSTGDLAITSNSVTLNPGFEVEVGGELSVIIGPCI